MQLEEKAWIRSCSGFFRLKRHSDDSGIIVLEKIEEKKAPLISLT
jgi:hypothetical protein